MEGQLFTSASMPSQMGSCLPATALVTGGSLREWSRPSPCPLGWSLDQQGLYHLKDSLETQLVCPTELGLWG